MKNVDIRHGLPDDILLSLLQSNVCPFHVSLKNVSLFSSLPSPTMAKYKRIFFFKQISIFLN